MHFQTMLSLKNTHIHRAVNNPTFMISFASLVLCKHLEPSHFYHFKPSSSSPCAVSRSFFYLTPPPPRLHFWVIIPFFISISIFSPQPNAPGDWDAVKLCHDEWLSFHSPLTGWLPRRAANAFVATGGIRLGYHCCGLSRSRIKDPIHTFPSNKSERLLPSSPSH